MLTVAKAIILAMAMFWYTGLLFTTGYFKGSERSTSHFLFLVIAWPFVLGFTISGYGR